MKLLHKTLLMTLLTASATSAMAADSLDIKVIGTITPAACVPTASGNGTFDYGTIKADSLSQDNFNVQPVLNQTLTITCDAPVKMALNFTDAKSASTVVPVGAVMKYPEGSSMTVTAGMNIFKGLGTAGDANIGAYTLSIVPNTIKLDGESAPINVIQSTDKKTWAKMAGLFGPSSQYTSFAADNTLTPMAFKLLTGTLNVQAAINKASALDLTQDIALDGQGTLQITYL